MKTLRHTNATTGAVETIVLSTSAITLSLAAGTHTLDVDGPVTLSRTDVTNAVIPVLKNRALRVVAVGNSLTQDFDNSGVRHAAPGGKQLIAGDITPGLKGCSFIQYAGALSGQRFYVVQNAALRGDDVIGRAGDWDAVVAPYQPDLVTFWLGTNSIDSDEMMANEQAAYLALLKKAESAGVAFIVLSIPPIPANMSRRNAWNAWLKQTCLQHGWLFFDTDPVLTDGNGSYLPQVKRQDDATGVHMNASQGDGTLARALLAAFPALAQGGSTTPLPTSAIPAHLYATPWFTDDVGAPGGGVTKSYEVRADGKGRNLVLTYDPSAGWGEWIDSLTGVAPGDTVRVVASVSASGFECDNDGGHNWTVGVKEVEAPYRFAVASAFQWRIDGQDMVLDWTATIPADFSKKLALAVAFGTGTAQPTNKPVLKLGLPDVISVATASTTPAETVITGAGTYKYEHLNTITEIPNGEYAPTIYRALNLSKKSHVNLEFDGSDSGALAFIMTASGSDLGIAARVGHSGVGDLEVGDYRLVIKTTGSPSGADWGDTTTLTVTVS